MRNSSDHTKGILAVFLTALLWSSGGLFIKLITLTPMQISFFRCLIAAIVFAILFRQKILKLNPLALLNSISYAAVLIFFVIATKTTTAANAIFLQSTAPIYVLIFEPLLTKTKWEKINVVTIAVCFVGMILFFMGDLTPGDIKGNLAALFAGVAFAAFFLGMKKNDKQYGEASIFYGNVIVAIVCIPFLFEMNSLTFSDLWKLTFLGVFQIAIAYALFSYGIKRILAVEASIISMLEPVLNPIWVFIGYGEVPSLYAIIGGVIIISAITIRTLIAGAPALKRKFTT
ncbi:EamA family transporter [Ignavibacterium sp.]|uniref:DMT family transporter n=1 Tax=Ignavibacterium sp. TaxID=2651167 RepID=UPI0021FACA37|nr:EamA family transporter [Ignavibacterium sp.]BDQ01564.1 MAG: membrane protein [Ignavibacterium sp.]